MVNVVGTGLSFRLFDDLLLSDAGFVEVDEGDLFALEPAGFGFGDAFNSADGEFAGPKTMLGEGDESGADSFGLNEGEDGGVFFCLGESFLHAGEELLDFELAVFAGDKVLALMVDESDDGEVPGRLVVFF